MPGSPIPHDWDEVTWRKTDVEIPDSIQWRSLLRGLLSGFSFRSFWDETTGDIDEAVAVGDAIIAKNTQLGAFPPDHTEDDKLMYIRRSQWPYDVSLGTSWTAGVRVLICEMATSEVFEDVYQWHNCAIWGYVLPPSSGWMAFDVDLVRNSDGYKLIDKWRLGAIYYNPSVFSFSLNSSWQSGNTPMSYLTDYTWKIYATQLFANVSGLSLKIECATYPQLARVRIETHSYKTLAE